MSDKSEAIGDAGETKVQIALKKVYLKDASYEAPNSPAVFSGEWKPKITLNLTTRSNDLGDDNFEVILEASVEAKQGDSTAFLAEVQQAGIFFLHGFSEDELQKVVATFCPTQLYPYVRESVADLVGKGGFPQLHLQPVSFEAMMAKAEADKKEGEETTGEASD